MRWIYECRDDVRFAVRQLTKAPGFAAVAGLTIALGIGATTAIFSVVHAVVLQPLPFPEPDRLMVIGEDFEGRGVPSDVSVGNFIDWRTHAKSFSALGALSYFSANLSDEGGPERVLGGRVTHTWFTAMGVAPQQGRVFTSSEDAPGRDRVVVLSHRLWTRRYGANPAVVGRPIQLNSVPFTVIGVMPALFDVTTDAEELWVPIAFTPAQLATHDEHYLSVIGRLGSGAACACDASSRTDVSCARTAVASASRPATDASSSLTRPCRRSMSALAAASCSSRRTTSSSITSPPVTNARILVRMFATARLACHHRIT